MVQKPVVLVVALAAAAGAVGGLLPSALSAPYDDSPIFVPGARYGDHAWYVGSQKSENPSSGGGSPWDSGFVDAPSLAAVLDVLPFNPMPPSGADASARSTEEVSLDFHVLGLQQWPDRAGHFHPAVVVDQTLAADRMRAFFDIENGVTIGMQGMQDGPEGPRRGSLFGPFSEFPSQAAYFPWLDFQGRELRLGQDFTGLGRDRMFAGVPSFPGFTFHAWIAERGRIDGRDSYAFRSEITFDAPTVEGSPGGHFFMVYDMWFSSEVPYPVLITLDMTMQIGASSFNAQAWTRLAKYTPGDRTISWVNPGAEGRYASRNTEGERTPFGQSHPSPGASSDLAFDLGTAIRTCSEEPPLEYRLWRLQNAEAALVGFQYAYVEDSLSNVEPSFHLLYATMQGRAVLLTASDSQPLGATCRYQGPATVPRFSLGDLPIRSLTFGVAEQIWKGTASGEFRGPGLNFLTWGFNPSSSKQNTTWLKLLTVGFHDGASPARFSLLSLDIERGVLASLVETGGFADRSGAGEALSSEKADVSPTYAAFGSRLPGLVGGAGLGAALLGEAALGIYYLPVIKVALFRLLLLAGYAKLRRDELLENPVRDSILQAVREDPGLSVSQMARRLGAGWGTVVYHLGVLESNGLVSSLVDGRHRRFFPVGVLNWSERGAYGLLQNRRTKDIYEQIQKMPGIGRDELSRGAGITGAAVLWHIRRLEEVGLVQHSAERRRFRYHAAERNLGGTPGLATPVPA